jgi:hypothetical protein
MSIDCALIYSSSANTAVAERVIPAFFAPCDLPSAS